MAAPRAVDPAYKYRAFISYSHADKLPGDWLRRRTWGLWLHQELEGYRVPRNLVGHAGRDGPLPQRIKPIFIDREELPTSSNLSANITDALKQSAYLIVICSPRAARSRWVNQEVISYKAMGREDRILCLIVDGVPKATDRPGAEEQECFPPAVRFRVAPDRKITDEPAEPIAADTRPHADGRGNARLKLIAGLLGINYDDLRQREKRRVFWQRVRLAAGTALMAGLLASVWQWQEERVHQKRIEGYVEQGRQLLLQEHPAKALAYLSAAYTEGGAAPALGFLLHQARLGLPNLSADRHTGRVFLAGFNPEGTRVVTACDDYTAKVWDTATGRLVATLAHPLCVNSAAYSPDGKTIVTACDDGYARIWDGAATGQPAPLIPPLPHAGKMFPAVFNQQGTLLAAASQEGTAMVWTSPRYRPLGPFNEHTEAINSLEFSPDGKLVVTASSDRTARIWDPLTQEQKAEPMTHDSVLIYARFSPDGARVVTCALSGQAGLWWSNGKFITWLKPPHLSMVRRAAFSPNGKLLVTASADGSAQVWNSETGDFIDRLPHVDRADAKQKLVFMVAFSRPDGRYLATAGQNGVVKVWDLTQPKARLAQQFTQHDEVEVIGVDFSQDGRLMSTAGGKGRAFIWDATDWTKSQPVAMLGGAAAVTGDADEGMVAEASRLRKLEGHTTYVASARFSSDGRRVATVDSPGRVRVWETETDGPPLVDSETGLSVNDAAFDRDGRRLVTGDNKGVVSRWELTAGSTVTKPAQTFPAFSGPVRSVLVLPDQRRLVVAGEDRKRNANRALETSRLVKFFELTGGEARKPIDGIKPVLSPDGQLLVTLNEGNVAKLWSTDGEAVATLTGHSGPLVSARFSADSLRVVTASDDGTAIIWDTAGRRGLTLNDHSGHGLFFAAFSPDGLRVVTIPGGKSPAKLWDAMDGREVVTLEGEQQYTASFTQGNILPEATFSPDGTLVATQCFTNLVNVWDVASGRQLARIKGHTGNLTALAFSPQGSRLLTGSTDGSLRIWDLGRETDSAEQVAQFVALRGKYQLGADGNPVEIRPAKPPAQ